MRTDQRNGLRSKAGFALLEVVMTIIIVGLAMGTAAMVLGTAVKVVQMGVCRFLCLARVYG